LIESLSPKTKWIGWFVFIWNSLGNFTIKKATQKINNIKIKKAHLKMLKAGFCFYTPFVQNYCVGI
jgi:hypothetical protein